ncbi:hypothetical protein [Candidatus Methylacidithermus pantelleriae]|uniref:hypothetical protein n=1 Tax=Candidatus Methylacidithermus pantelleriae TaxID=2744239 RepID=UPI001BD521B0|nr:hypothetical protein [Candidatus Methylacidithermus pantelleriae]
MARARKREKRSFFPAEVELIGVNPAYTSVMGAVNRAASCPQLERIGSLGTRIRARGSRAYSQRGSCHLALPASDWTQHVWSFPWRWVRKRLKAVHGAHALSGNNRLAPMPLPPKTWDWGAIQVLPAKSRHANRRQRRSAGIPEDLPW